MTSSQFLAVLLLAGACGRGPEVPRVDGTVRPQATTTGPDVARQGPKDFADLLPIEGAELRTDYEPEALLAACSAAGKAADEKLAMLLAIPDAKRTFADSFEALENIWWDYAEATGRLAFLQHVHTSAQVREAAGSCAQALGKYGAAFGARKDIYLALKGYLDNAGQRDQLDPQARRLVDNTMRHFRRNGLGLPDDQRNELLAIRQRLTELGSTFYTNLNEDRTTFTVNRRDLAGMSPDWIKSHKVAKDGSIVVTTTGPDYDAVMHHGKTEATRRKMETAFMNRGGAANEQIVKEQIQLRARAARLLGYPSHLDFTTEDRMVKNAATVTAFLDRLRDGLTRGLAADTERMQKRKAAETGARNARIHAWDWRYYLEQIKRTDYAVDDEEVRRYFPHDKVMAGLFEIYAGLFGVTFREVAGAKTWADGVHLYEVRDAASNRLLAKFYVDLYSREGKFGQVGVEFRLTPGHATPAGYAIPWSCLLLNVSRSKDGQPAFLTLRELDVLFHEFGHVMHESLTTARYPSQAGTNVATDFVEAPSQMLGNWVYEPEVLARISRDPQHPTQGMPADLARKIAAARKYNAIVWNSRGVFLASYDATVHTTDPVDPDRVAKELWAGIMRFPQDPDAHFPRSFLSYDGGVYSYLWSNVLQADMFTRFQGNVLDPRVGRAFRDVVLAPSGTVDPEQLVHEFLGRPPSEDAFLAFLGIR